MNTYCKWKKVTGYLLGTLIGLGASLTPAWAGHPEVSLPGSNFEIEDPTMGNGANIKVDNVLDPDSIDWANIPGRMVAEDINITVGNKFDDSAFGQGTAEDTFPPSVVAGGIPPNKSNLLKFGVATEETEDYQFMHLFWTRANNPSGTVNMDFEFNQSEESVVYNTNPPITIPQRTAGDLLIQYDLTGGGTDLANVELWLSRWVTAASAGGAPASTECEASNRFPCWGVRNNLTTDGNATGSANGAIILTGDAAGLDDGMGLDEVTFGEASINLTEVLGDGALQCFTFGSAYLKSRSSDSFNAALKDFIPPIAVNISNCGSFTLVKKDDNDALLEGAGFTLYEDDGDLVYDDQVDTTVFDTCTTDSSGGCLFENVLPGGYCLVETSTPANHLGADPKCFTFDPDADPLTLEFINRRLGSILVKKVKKVKEGDPEVLLPGAVFQVTAASPTPVTEDEVPALPLTMTESQAGYHCVDGLPLKGADLNDFTYTVKELTPPVGYIGADDQMTMATVGTCAERGTTSPDLTFVNTRKPGAIKITKTTKAVPAGEIPHGKVTFKVYDGPTTGNPVGTVVTDPTTGVACLGDLDVGTTYTVVETVPTGYAAEDPKEVTITTDATCGSGDEDEVDFHNTPLGKFTISYDSLPEDGYGKTKATVNCGTGSGIAVNVDLFDGDEVPSGELNFETQATWICTIVIDP
ncbi:MSCRAMM family protein [Oceanimonas marisflavi]|uniref:MSCRAMM family protein n=1 Tax=Oceanimonas marisflavi TaxID=2059724 RepID=UPI000D31054A|nr:SpaA isopeptide-forming pilin-related protein [Oceanimonas marisflavi]